jgi:di/tricarboxylate transporter
MLGKRIELGPDLLDRLLMVPSMQKLPRRKIAGMVPRLECYRLSVGDEIFAAKQPAEYIYWVIEGQVTLSGPSGKHRMEAGDTFGEEALQAGGVYVQTATATANAVVIRLAASPAQSLFSDTAAFQGLLSELIRRLTGHGFRSGESKAEENGDQKQDWLRVAGWLATMILPPLLFIFGRGTIAEGNQLVFLCISLATVLMWGFRLMNEFIPSIFAILSILILNIAPPEVALVGFTDGSFYLALSIFGLSSLIVSSGLAFRMVLWMLRAVPVSPRWHAWSLFSIGTLLTPLLPSANGRIALMMPLLKDLIESSNYKPGGRTATYLFMSGFASFTMLSTIFLSSKTIHFVIFGLLPQQVKERFSWSYWLLASLAAGAVLVIGIFLLLEYYSRGKEDPGVTREQIKLQYRAFGPVTLPEWAALGGVMLFILGISTESLHKIQLPWIGLMVLYATLAVGLLSPKQFRVSTDWTFLLYLGTLIGFVSTISYLGLDKQAAALFSFLGHYMKNQFWLFVVILSATVIVLRFFVPTNTAVAILASVLFPMAQALGVNPWVVGFILLILSDIWFFPYQCTYYLQIESQVEKDPHLDMKTFYRFNAVSNVLRIVAVFASIPFWKWLGLL